MRKLLALVCLALFIGALYPPSAAVADEVPKDATWHQVFFPSGDGTMQVAEAAAPGARLVPSPENEGFPAACNRGAARAFGDLLVFLNPDAVLARTRAIRIRDNGTWQEPQESPHRAIPHLGAAGPGGD